MKNLSRKLKTAILTACSVFVSPLIAATYYVNTNGGDDSAAGTSADAPFLTVDKAISQASAAGDEIHVAPGTYTTSTQWGPQLKCKLVGDGATRDEVVIQASDAYRTLRLASTAVLTNVTVIGNTNETRPVDKGGALEITGGQVIDCVIKNGLANGNDNNLAGGNVYMSGATALLRDCLISGGDSLKRAGNVYLDDGRIENCTLENGKCDNIGGNLFAYRGVVSNCILSAGSVDGRGGNAYLMGTAVLQDSTVRHGQASSNGGNVYVTDTAQVLKSTITHGTTTGDGGNVFLEASGVLADSTLKDGVTTVKDKKGSNLYIVDSARASRSQFIGGSNEAYNAGSVCIYSANAVLEDCLITGSTCGGLLYGSSKGIYNTTIIKNKKYGVWAWTTGQHFFNTVIYGNTLTNEAGVSSNTDYTGNLPSSSSDFASCAVGDGGRFKESSYPGLVLLGSNQAFVDYDSDDFRPAENSPLVDAGVEDPRGAAASTTDLAGTYRVVNQVDIGCYEYQCVVADIALRARTSYHIPATITFEATLQNGEDLAISQYTWNFGDGSEEVVTETATVEHAYTEIGLYSVTCRITVEDGQTYTNTKENFIPLYDKTVWVNGGGKPQFPYNTRETGLRTLAEAVAIQDLDPDCQILIAPGVYEQAAQITVTNTIQIIGQGTSSEDVILRNTKEASSSAQYCRVLEVTGGAKISNLVMENGAVWSQNGGCLRLTAGVVSNCVIRGGTITNGGGGGVEIGGTAATLTHCVVTNNSVIGTNKEDQFAGGAIFIPWRGNPRILNTLIANNTYVPSASGKQGTAGVMFGGGNEHALMENCSVVGNVVKGDVSNDSPGVVCTAWYTTFRNTVIAGNRETDKPDTVTCVGFGDYIKTEACVLDAPIKINDKEIAQAGVTIAQAQDIFKNFENANYLPIAGKALANKGVQPTYIATVDLAGKPRVFGKAIDIGCYETQSLPGLKIIIR